MKKCDRVHGISARSSHMSTAVINYYSHLGEVTGAVCVVSMAIRKVIYIG